MATSRVHSSSAHLSVGSPEPKPPFDLANSFPGSDDVRRDEIEAQLERILASSSFRNSRRHTHFLRFVVEKCLSGHSAEIKERLIGIEVFDRPADYDLTSDPIVRGAAVELRKRIAQYYADPLHAGELRFDLPLGTYVPTFHRPHQQNSVELALPAAEWSVLQNPVPTAGSSGGKGDLHPEAKKKRPLWRAVITSAALILAVAAGFAFLYSRPDAVYARALNSFWAPLMNGGDAVTVCVGDLNYIFKAPPWSDQLQLHPVDDNLLNPNAGAALLRVGSILGARGKRSTLRLADLTELNDLRQQPVIFIGGMNNPWTQRILANLRFRMTSNPAGPSGRAVLVTDERRPAMTAWNVDLTAPLSSITRDYSLVTRLNDPLTGEPVVILCGLGPYGTAAASEFVSNPSYFSEFSKQAPKGWQSRNLQIVLETRVVDGRVSVPRVVAEQVY